MALRTSEWISLIYFSSILVSALAVRVGAVQRRDAIGTAIVTSAVILALAPLHAPAAVQLRPWTPLAYMLIGYRVPARLVTGTNHALEQRLMALDHRWLGVQPRRSHYV